MLSLTALTTAPTFLKKLKDNSKCSLPLHRQKHQVQCNFLQQIWVPRWLTKLHGHQSSWTPAGWVDARQSQGSSLAELLHFQPSLIPSEMTWAPPLALSNSWIWNLPQSELPSDTVSTQGCFQPLQIHITKQELDSGSFPGSKPGKGEMGSPHLHLCCWRWISAQGRGWESPRTHDHYSFTYLPGRLLQNTRNSLSLCGHIRSVVMGHPMTAKPMLVAPHLLSQSFIHRQYVCKCSF